MFPLGELFTAHNSPEVVLVCSSARTVQSGGGGGVGGESIRTFLTEQTWESSSEVVPDRARVDFEVVLRNL